VESRVGEMAALITVNDLRLTSLQCPFQAVQDKRFINSAGEFIIHNKATVPVDAASSVEAVQIGFRPAVIFLMSL
jgi:hypothetical protein